MHGHNGNIQLNHSISYIEELEQAISKDTEILKQKVKNCDVCDYLENQKYEDTEYLDWLIFHNYIKVLAIVEKYDKEGETDTIRGLIRKAKG